MNRSWDIFKEGKDYADWDKHKEYILKHEEIDENLKVKVVNAIDIMRRELGNSLLNIQNEIHPFLSMVDNIAPWELNRLIIYADILDKIKNTPKYNLLKKKLRSPFDCKEEGIPFLDVIYWATNSGLDISEMECNIEGFNKHPDLRLDNPHNKERIYIELTHAEIKDVSKLKTENYNKLFHAFHFSRPVLPFSAKQLKIIETTEQMEMVLRNIQEQKELVKKKNEFAHYCDEYIDMAITGYDKLEKLDLWVREKKYPKDLLGLFHDFNQNEKIGDIVNRKAKQIPPQYPGILLIRIPVQVFIFGRVESYCQVVKQKMIKFDNLIGVGLYTHFVNANAEDGEVYGDDYLHIRRIKNELFVKEIIFLRMINFHFN